MLMPVHRQALIRCASLSTILSILKLSKATFMYRILFVITSALFVIWLTACNSNDKVQAVGASSNASSFDKEWAKSFIDSVNTKFSEQIAAGDSASLASHYWSDAEL